MITPKEEAIELVDKFVNGVTDEEGTPSIYYSEAKQCALITINQLIKVTGSKHYYDVKKEIEKL